MKLRIGERLILLGILPNEGNFATLKIVRKLQAELSFDEKEFKEYSIVQEGDKVNWSAKKDIEKPKDVVIGEKANDIIFEALKKLDNENKLTQDHFSLCEKFNILNEDIKNG